MRSEQSHTVFPLCVLTPEVGVLSETFIQWDIEELLPGGTVAVADPPPCGATTQRGRAWTTRAPMLELQPLPGDPPPSQDRRVAVSEFLRQHAVQVVLIEYLDFATRWLDALTELPARVWVRGHGIDVSAHLRDKQTQHAYRELSVADGIMVPSRSAAQRLLSVGLPPSRIHVIPNHTHVPAEINPGRRRGESLRCVAAGRLVPKKGHLYSLEAFRAAVEINPEMTLDIIGEGPLRGELELYTAKNRLAAKVQFLGARPHTQFLQQLRQYDVLLHHAVTSENGDAEGMPLVVLEAMAAGVCVAATSHEGISDLVTDGVNGLLVAERDSAAMARAVTQLARDPALRDRLASEGRRTVCARYSHEYWRPRKRAMLGLPDLAVTEADA